MYMNKKDEFIKNCYENCDGYNLHCGIYKSEILLSFHKGESCCWHKVIQTDVEKINNNDMCLTFGILEKLVKKNE